MPPRLYDCPALILKQRGRTRLQENKLEEMKLRLFAAAVEHKNWWAEESKRIRLAGEREPDFLYHPDKLHINYANGTVAYLGMTEDEKKYIEMMNRLKGLHQWAALDILKEDPPLEQEYLKDTWDELRHCLMIIAKFDASMGMPPWPTEPPDCPNEKELDDLEKRIVKERGFTKKPKGKL
jgi:hypothetical protein